MIRDILFGDCLEVMKTIPDNSVDMVLCDPPYKVTARQDWDEIIPFDLMWEQYNRICKENAAMVLFATEPFRTKLIYSNINNFRYDYIWVKNKSTGFLNAKKQPLRAHESILVFYRTPCRYYPQKTSGHKPVNSYTKTKGKDESFVYGATKPISGGGSTERYPNSILYYNVVNNDSKDKIHSAQKPVPLCEYLISTYTAPGELVLDNCSGSGTTLVAAKNLNRQYIGIERERTYYDLSKQRLA